MCAMNSWVQYIYQTLNVLNNFYKQLTAIMVIFRLAAPIIVTPPAVTLNSGGS